MTFDYYLAVFNSTHHAIKFEKELKEAGFLVSIIPVPREIAASCGLAAKFELDKYDDICKTVELNSLQVAAYYHVSKSGDKRVYDKK